MTDSEADLVRLDAARALRDHFLGWQCRIRQMSVRQHGGRPSPGMRPQVLPADPAKAAPDPVRITVLIVRREPEETTAEFRHMFRRTRDPRDRYNRSVQLLSAAYYQHPREFSDELTALFGPESALAAALVEAGRCRLVFEQYSQRYDLPCAVRELADTDPAYQATLWHNRLFNPNIPGNPRILGFKPDWSRAVADPPVGAR